MSEGIAIIFRLFNCIKYISLPICKNKLKICLSQVPKLQWSILLLRLIKFPMGWYGRKRGMGDGLLEEVSSFLEEICSSFEVVYACLGRVCSFLENVSSSTYHCSSGNHYGQVAKPVFGQTTIHTLAKKLV